MDKRLILMVLSAFLASSLSAKELTRAQHVMGTVCEITVYGDNGKKMNKALTRAFSQILEADLTLSTYKKASEVSQINDRADISPQYCSRMAFNALKSAQQFWISTQGAFDITVEPLNKIWNQPNQETWPTDTQLQAATSLTGMQYIELNYQNQSIWFQKKGMGLNFGGIGKGIAIDLAAKTLKKGGIKKGRINFGGQIYVFGPDSEEEEIHISHPLDPNIKATSLYLSNGSVSTSSQRKQWNSKQNHYDSHILDPRTGNPAPFPGSVTVVAQSATQADAISTALFVMGMDKGLSWAKNNRDICAVFVVPREKDSASIFSSSHCQELNVVLGPELDSHF